MRTNLLTAVAAMLLSAAALTGVAKAATVCQTGYTTCVVVPDSMKIDTNVVENDRWTLSASNSDAGFTVSLVQKLASERRVDFWPNTAAEVERTSFLLDNLLNNHDERRLIVKDLPGDVRAVGFTTMTTGNIFSDKK